MLRAVRGDAARVLGRAQVAHAQALPVEPADAAGAVAPGDSGAEGEFVLGVLVGAGLVDFRPDPGDSIAHRAGVGIFCVEQFDELLRRGEIGHVTTRRIVNAGNAGLGTARAGQRRPGTAIFRPPNG